MGEKEYEATYKILILGDSGVGKTCLIFRFIEDVFSDSYISTIGIDCRSRVVNLDGTKVRLQIWDTAGQERFRTLTSAYYRGAMGIILVYDITTEDSFKHIAQWLQNIQDNASPDVCRVLVGNKVDAEDERMIDSSRGKLITENAELEFFETSARTGEGVTETPNIPTLFQRHYFSETISLIMAGAPDGLLIMAFMAVARQIKEFRQRKGARVAYQDSLNPVLESEQQQEHSNSAACCSS